MTLLCYMTDESGKHSTNETEQSYSCPKEKRMYVETNKKNVFTTQQHNRPVWQSITPLELLRNASWY